MTKEVFVYVDYQGDPLYAGKLWSRVKSGHESASFAYSPKWLENSARFSLSPDLVLGVAAAHTKPRMALFGAFDDSCPDRWGRTLLRKAARRQGLSNEIRPKSLFEIDFLLSVDDVARQGALRFKIDPDGPFLAAHKPKSLPPVMRLTKILNASERIANDEENDDDIRLLLAPGSSLGGARPKSTVIDLNGDLALAKFPNRFDQIDVVLWEAVALNLAEKAGVTVPHWQVRKVGERNVIILKRFDRRNGFRIPFLSAMSMLQARDHDTHSYLEIADAIRLYGAKVSLDLAQLWRRIVFNVLISNTDDHLRNHGFLHFGGDGWRLSPAFDMNPIPTDVKVRVMSTTIDYDDPTASVELAIETCEYYGITRDVALTTLEEVRSAIRSWRSVADELGVTANEIKRMSSAFELAD